MAETLLATTLAHKLALIRFSRKLGKDAQSYIDEIMKVIRDELLSTDKITTKKRRDEIIALVNEIMGVELQGWDDELEKELRALAKEEVKFHQATLANLVGQKVARPTLDSVIKTAFNTEMVLNGQAYTIDERIKNYNANSVDKIKRIITGGWRDGLTTYEMMQEIAGNQNSSVSNQMRKGAFGLAKDSVSHISSVAKTSVGMKNSDIVIGEKAVATLDSRASPKCARIASEDGGGREYIYAEVGYSFERPPHHHFCRTTHQYILSDEFKELQEPKTRPAVVNGKAKKVDSNEDLFELAKANPNMARELVGVERAKVLEAVSAKEFTKIAYNRLDEFITLDELVKKSKVAAKALGRE